MKWKISLLILGVVGLVVLFAAGCSRPKGNANQGKETPIAYYVDPMNPANISDHPGKAPCGMDMVPIYVGDKNIQGIRIDPAVVQNIGVTTEVVKRRDLQKEIRTSGSVAVEEPKVYAVTAKIAGYAEKLLVDYTGQKVRQDEPLLEIYSPELVSTQEEYLQALRYVRQLGADATDEVKRSAQEMVVSTKNRLLNWDIPEQEIQALETRGTANKTMLLRSPASGVVLQKNINQGQKIEAGMQLYQIADLSRVWVVVDLYQQDLPYIQIGQKVTVELEYLPGKPFEGVITYISPVLDQDSKTATARIEVKNTPNFEIKPGMFAAVKILAPAVANVVAVPQQAIIYSGERHIVIVSLGNGYFKPVEVKCGISAGGYAQNLSGIQEGQKVVTSAQFLIDSESNLKAAIQQMGAGKSSAMPGMDMPGKDHNPPAAGPPTPKAKSQPTNKMPGM